MTPRAADGIPQGREGYTSRYQSRQSRCCAAVQELVRAYDILTDAEQRATYDELLAIALQPPRHDGRAYL
jgi:hypothetical protein